MYCVMPKVVIGVSGSGQAGEVGGAPLMRVEEEGPLRKNLDSATDKPPNVLVYAANNAEYYNKVQQTLTSCLNPDRWVFIFVVAWVLHVTELLNNVLLNVCYTRFNFMDFCKLVLVP